MHVEVLQNLISIVNDDTLFDCDNLLNSIYEESFTLRGKRVDISGNRIRYNDFFRVLFDRDTGNTKSIHTSKGVDVLSFSIVGLCFNLLYAGKFCKNVSHGYFGERTFLNPLAEFVDEGLEKNLTLDELDLIASRFDLYSLKSDLTSTDFKERFEIDSHKSLFFTECFGVSNLNSNYKLISELLPKMMCIALTDNADKFFTEMFCRFKDVITIGGLRHIGVELKKYKDKKRIVDSSKKEISDIIGVSRMIAFILSSDLGSYYSCIDSGYIDKIGDYIWDVLGSDFIADYLIKQEISSDTLDKLKDYSSVRVKDADESESGKYISSNIREVNLLFSCIRNYDLYDIIVDTDKVFTGVMNTILSKNSWYGALVHYVLYPSQKEFFNSARGTVTEKDSLCEDLSKKLSESDSVIRGLKDELRLLHKQIDSTSTDEEVIFRLNKEITTQTSRSEDLANQVEELKQKLQNQALAVDELLTSLECSDDAVVSDVSMEEMIKMLNGFRLCFVGGRYDMTDKLNALGLHNFVQAGNVSDVSRIDSFDFAISMTSFLSHHLFYLALSKLGSERDRHMYFNGTNLNNLISSCYNFITHYFEINK